MLNIKRLTEFKPRKAKFGFKMNDAFELYDIIPTSKLLKSLYELFDKPGEPDSFAIEFGVPYKGRTVAFKLYTDIPEVAQHIRTHFANPL
jgi:hypothetical protein